MFGSFNGRMEPPPITRAYGPTINRVADLMAHTSRYSFKGTSRLAADAGVSPSAVSRLLHGKLNPSFVLVARVTGALEAQLGRRIDPRDLVAEHGEFLTAYACGLAACPGCLPENALDEFGDLKPAFEGIRPGAWVASRYPRGLHAGKEAS